MIITVTKRFDFAMAHRLSDYKGKCEHLHGHNYQLEVTVGGDSLNEQGMVIDFGELKKIVNENVVELFDHRTLLKKGDKKNEAIGKALKGELDICWVDYNPTAENMLNDIFARLEGPLFALSCFIMTIRLYETESSYAEINPFFELVEDDGIEGGGLEENELDEAGLPLNREGTVSELYGNDFKLKKDTIH